MLGLALISRSTVVAGLYTFSPLLQGCSFEHNLFNLHSPLYSCHIQTCHTRDYSAANRDRHTIILLAATSNRNPSGKPMDRMPNTPKTSKWKIKKGGHRNKSADRNTTSVGSPRNIIARAAKGQLPTQRRGRPVYRSTRRSASISIIRSIGKANLVCVQRASYQSTPLVAAPFEY